MKKKSKIWTSGIIGSLVPAILVWIGQSDMLLRLKEHQYIGINVDVNFIKDVSAILGVVLTFGFLTRPLIISELNEQKYHVQRDRLIKYNKEIFLKVFCKTLGLGRCDLEIRIFVPERGWKYRLNKLLKKDVPFYYKIKNLEGLADPGTTEDLRFQVYPKQEGLVGQCFQERTILYDDNLEENNDTKYNLNEYQINKTSDLKFVLVCPIMALDNSVQAVVAFDSKTQIKVTEANRKNLTNIILNYTQALHDLVPEFFK